METLNSQINSLQTEGPSANQAELSANFLNALEVIVLFLWLAHETVPLGPSRLGIRGCPGHLLSK